MGRPRGARPGLGSRKVRSPISQTIRRPLNVSRAPADLHVTLGIVPRRGHRAAGRNCFSTGARRAVGQKRQHLFSAVANAMPETPSPRENTMAAKFEISKAAASLTPPSPPAAARPTPTAATLTPPPPSAAAPPKPPAATLTPPPPSTPPAKAARPMPAMAAATSLPSSTPAALATPPKRAAPALPSATMTSPPSWAPAAPPSPALTSLHPAVSTSPPSSSATCSTRTLPAATSCSTSCHRSEGQCRPWRGRSHRCWATG